MNGKQVTKNGNDSLNEVVDMLMESYDQMASDEKIRGLVLQGDFSNKDFEWLAKRSSVPPGERRAMDNSDRQHKLRVKRTIIKAMATLSWAHYFSDVFEDEEWEDISPINSIYGLVFMSALKGGYENALTLSIALDNGLNERMKVESSGMMRAEVRVILVPDSEGMKKANTEIAERFVRRIQGKIKDEQDSQ